MPSARYSTHEAAFMTCREPNSIFSEQLKNDTKQNKCQKQF